MEGCSGGACAASALPDNFHSSLSHRLLSGTELLDRLANNCPYSDMLGRQPSLLTVFQVVEKHQNNLPNPHSAHFIGAQGRSSRVSHFPK